MAGTLEGWYKEVAQMCSKYNIIKPIFFSFGTWTRYKVHIVCNVLHLIMKHLFNCPVWDLKACGGSGSWMIWGDLCHVTLLPEDLRWDWPVSGPPITESQCMAAFTSTLRVWKHTSYLTRPETATECLWYGQERTVEGGRGRDWEKSVRAWGKECDETEREKDQNERRQSERKVERGDRERERKGEREREQVDKDKRSTSWVWQRESERREEEGEWDKECGKGNVNEWEWEREKYRSAIFMTVSFL